MDADHLMLKIRGQLNNCIKLFVDENVGAEE